MTQRERAAHAAKWRKIARKFENYRLPRFACGLCFEAREAEESMSPIHLFGSRWWFWDFSRKGDDCRVIAAGLIAAMYETGEFDA